MPRREYVGGAPQTELVAPIGGGDLSFIVDDGAGYPTGAVGPFFVVLDAGTSIAEKVLCSTRSGNTFTVAGGGRGADDTVGVSHLAGATVQHIFTATDADEANAHVNSDAGVHGVSTNLVGVDDTQTLTNKTLSGAANTFSNIPQTAITDLLTDQAAQDSDIAQNASDIDALEVVTGEFDSDPLAVAPAPTASHTNYPVGMSVRSATTSNGWLANGTLITWRYPTTGTHPNVHQELTRASTEAVVRRYIRHWASTDWSPWILVPGASPTTGLLSQGELQRAILILRGNGGAPTVSGGTTRGMNTQVVQTNIGPFGTTANSVQYTVPFSGLYLFVATGEFIDSGGVNYGMQIREGGTSDPESGTAFAFSHDTRDSTRANQTIHACENLSAGTLIKWNVVNFGGTTMTIQNDRTHLFVEYKGPAS